MQTAQNTKGTIILFLTIYAFLLLLFSTFSCKVNSSPVQIDFSRTEPLDQNIFETPKSGSIRFAIVAGNFPTATTNLYTQLFEYIGNKLGSHVQFEQRKTYAEINELLRTGEIDFAIISSYSYIRVKEEFGVESVAVPVINGKSVSLSYIVVRSDSGISKFQELKGKAYAFTHPSSTYGRLVPVYKLALMGETPQTFFSRYIFTYNNDKSIKAVEDGLVDGASVDSTVYDYLVTNNPQRINKTNVIDTSIPYGINPIVISPHSSGVLKNAVSKILLNMHKDQHGQIILKELKFDRFATPDEESYKSIKTMRDFIARKFP